MPHNFPTPPAPKGCHHHTENPWHSLGCVDYCLAWPHWWLSTGSRATRPGGAEKPCDLVSSFSAGAEDQCALDSVLWHPQCFRARVQLDPGAPGPGGLRDRRGPPVVSKCPALAIQQDSQSIMFMAFGGGGGRVQRWYARASGIQEVSCSREEYH